MRVQLNWSPCPLGVFPHTISLDAVRLSDGGGGRSLVSTFNFSDGVEADVLWRRELLLSAIIATLK